LTKGDFAEALVVKEETLHILNRRFDLIPYVRVLDGSCIAYSCLGRWDEALREGQEALRAAEEFSDKVHISFSAWTISIVYAQKGDLERAREYGELAVEKDQGKNLWAETVLAWVWCKTGDPNRGVAELSKNISLYQSVAFLAGIIWWAPYLLEGYWIVGEYEKGRELGKNLLEMARSSGARPAMGLVQRLLGEIALATNSDEAAAHFEHAISIFREIKAENELALAYSGMGRFHKQQGNVEQARGCLTKALEIFERLGTLIEPDKVKAELFELPQ
jgi:tetratricopeptide (TPR) repeat protein